MSAHALTTWASISFSDLATEMMEYHISILNNGHRPIRHPPCSCTGRDNNPKQMHNAHYDNVIFRVTGPLWGESIGHQWIHLIKASNAELWLYIYGPEQTIETPAVRDAMSLNVTSLWWYTTQESCTWLHACFKCCVLLWFGASGFHPYPLVLFFFHRNGVNHTIALVPVKPPWLKNVTLRTNKSQ